MRIIAFIEEKAVIRKILLHLNRWEEPEPLPAVPEQADVQYVPFFDREWPPSKEGGGVRSAEEDCSITEE